MADEANRLSAATTLELVDALGHQRDITIKGRDVNGGLSRDQQILDILIGLTRMVQQNTAGENTDGSARLTVPMSLRYDIAALADTVRSIRSDVRALRRNWAVASLPVRNDGAADAGAAWPVSAAEAATDTILNAVDRIDSAVTRYAGDREDPAGTDLAAVVDAETVRIVEACNAQDVVLRRLHRVVEAIVALEPVLDRLAVSADALESL